LIVFLTLVFSKKNCFLGVKLIVFVCSYGKCISLGLLLELATNEVWGGYTRSSNVMKIVEKNMKKKMLKVKKKKKYCEKL
jgi:hypothetical protein